jgi:hypothetical protein
MRDCFHRQEQQNNKPGDETRLEDLHGIFPSKRLQESSTGAAKRLDGLKFAIQNFHLRRS